MTTLLVALSVAIIVGAGAIWIYRHRELPIAGRGRLAALRVLTLAGVVMLLADPTLPVAGTDGPPTRWVAVDASGSMAVAGPSGERPWDRAIVRVTDQRPGVRRATFAGDPAPTSPPDSAQPTGESSRLVPLLRRAAESGAHEIDVVTDLRLEDVAEVAVVREMLGLTLRFIDVGEPIRSAGVGDLRVPATGRAGATDEVEIEVFGTASAAGDTARVELLRDGSVVETRTVRVPQPGRTVVVPIPVTLPDSAGPVLWQARVDLDDDAFGGDDRRSAFSEVDPVTGLLALISLTPDWEPRFLLPVLGRVTGLPARGWLKIGDDAFLPMDGSGGVLDGSALARIAQDARLLVVHGLAASAPDWLVSAQARGRRVLVFAADAAGARSAGLETGEPRPGEWYGVAAAGPLAGSLAGVPWADLPPLSSPLVSEAGGAEALEVERPGGVRAGVVSLQDQGERRRAVVMARGFWRWALRPGPEVDAYDRLWSGMAGWLLGLEDGVPGGGLGPAEKVAAGDRPVAWWAPVAAEGRIEVTTTAATGEQRTDTLEVGADGRAWLPERADGAYRWSAGIVVPDSLAQRGRIWTGRLELESHTDEFRWPRDTRLLAEGTGAGRTQTAGTGRPLRTSPWPYLILLGLLSAEWILRRRSGLR